MCSLKKVMLSLFMALVIALPAGLYGQDNSMQNSGTDSLDNNSGNNTGTNSMNSTDNRQSMDNAAGTFASGQLDQAFARLQSPPDDNVKTELEGVAETQARDLQTKMGLDDDAYGNIKDAINDYLKEGWSDRVELAQKAGNPDDYKDKSADLAYLRVDLAEQIKDEIGDGAEGKWNSNAVDFWTSLDQADFRVKAKEAGIPLRDASETMDQNQQQMNNQNQMQMNNGDNMNGNQNNNQNNTDQNNSDQNNSDQENSDQNNNGQNGNDQSKPDQGQGTGNQGM